MFLEERRMERQKNGPEEIRDWQQILSRWRRHNDNDYFQDSHDDGAYDMTISQY